MQVNMLTQNSPGDFSELDRTSLVILRLHFCVNVASQLLSSHHKVLNPDRFTENQLKSKNPSMETESRSHDAFAPHF